MINLTKEERKYLKLEVVRKSTEPLMTAMCCWMKHCNRNNKIGLWIGDKFKSKENEHDKERN